MLQFMSVLTWLTQGNRDNTNVLRLVPRQPMCAQQSLDWHNVLTVLTRHTGRSLADKRRPHARCRAQSVGQEVTAGCIQQVRSAGKVIKSLLYRCNDSKNGQA
jgi:hypothetical protein